MFNGQERAIVAAVHPNLIVELKLRRKIVEDLTNRKTKGGLTCLSQMASEELKAIRQSGEEILKEINFLKIKSEGYNYKFRRFINEGNEVFVSLEEVKTEFIPLDFFKRIYILASALHKKKDQKQLKIEVTKVKGLKKNEINYFW